MSGGALFDYGSFSTYSLERIGERLRGCEDGNVALGELVLNLAKVLEAWDLYMSGDIDREDAMKAWLDFENRFLSPHAVAVETKESILRECREMIERSGLR